MKATLVLVALALAIGAASAQTLGDCRVNMGYAAPFQPVNALCALNGKLDNCGKCDCYYSGNKEQYRRLCYNCLVNLRGINSADYEDCWSPYDDGLAPALAGVYDKCTTQRCFDCVTNFKNKQDDKIDLCKMVESIYCDSTSLQNLAFDCLSNTQGNSKPGFWYKTILGPFYSSYLRTSPCLQLKTAEKKDLDRKCTTANCFYCLTNFASVADETQRWASWNKCKACESNSNFWGCVYGK